MSSITVESTQRSGTGDGDLHTQLRRLNSIEENSLKDQAITVIRTLEDEHTFALDDEALSSILLHPDIIDRKVAVVSVAGAFRKGKSFLLNFFLRYLTAHGSVENATELERWVGEEDQTLEGFSWRGGSERETSGILLWRQPFLVTRPNGDKIAVLLMDTQGAFDSQSTVKDCATIFALSTMVSSLQIYNLSQNIQEDDLQHLQLFTEYGRLALEDCDSKPFQSLLFLVRDWSFPYEAEYGFDGGMRMLERRLQVSENQHQELQQLRRHIRSCFDSIGCFLMPHPGLKVATNPTFTGKLSDIEEEFKRCLRVLVPKVLAPENLVLKEINGHDVTCRELLEYFKAYILIFQGEDLPAPKSMLEATAEANNLAAVASSKALYTRSMEDICGGETPYMNQNDLESYHGDYREESLRLFVETRKMGGEEYSQQFLDRLDSEVNEAFENFVKVNNSKNLFRSFRTPAVLFVLLLVDYAIKEVLEWVYLESIARIFSSILFIILASISVWGYIRYSGNLREVGQNIDEFSAWIWEQVLSPASSYVMQEGVKRAHKLSTNMHQNNGTVTATQTHATRKPSNKPEHRKR